MTKRFKGSGGRVTGLECARLEFSTRDRKGCPVMKEIPGSAFDIEADIVIIAVGFLHPEHTVLIKDLDVALDGRGNVGTGPDYMTSVKGVFAAGDMRRGQSLVVWAISEGRRAAYSIDSYLMGSSSLPAL
jgi:glutamate synthase (NADPH/NADH) small chain